MWLELKNKELANQLRQHNVEKAYGIQAWIDGFNYREKCIDDHIKSLIVPDEGIEPTF